ncbi:MAG: nucleotidyltransferase domain-containing protein [Thermoleophilaceae bacterium]
MLARADVGLTGRRVAALAGVSVSGAAKVLESLVRGGLVHRVDAGSASLYSLNQAHVGAAAVTVLAEMRAEVITRMREEISHFSHPPLSALLFGSAARGDGDEDSDVDLLLVRPAEIDEDDEHWMEDIEQLGSAVRSWTGNPLSLHEYSLAELRTGSSGRRSLLARLQREGILLYGAELRTLLTRSLRSGSLKA